MIDRTAPLREMPEGTRAALAAAGSVRRFRSGSYLWRTGDPEDGLHVVAEGIVHIGNIGPDGEEIVLHLAGPGVCIGEPGIYAPERDRRTDGCAVGRTTIVWIPTEAVRAALEASPAAMRTFARQLSAIARSHARRLASNAFHDARGRLARVLLELLASDGAAASRGHRIGLRLTQRTLAGLIGVRREHVNRLVASLKREGVVAFERGIVTVLDEPRLRSALGIEAGLH